MKKVVLVLSTVIVASLIMVMVASAGPPTPITATLTATTSQFGFIYADGGNLITRNRIYSGTLSDIDGDTQPENILIIEDSTCQLPCSIPSLNGRNRGVIIVYLSGTPQKVIEGRFEGRLLPNGIIQGTWWITAVASSLAGLLTHGHGYGSYTGSISGPGFTATLTGLIHI